MNESAPIVSITSGKDTFAAIMQDGSVKAWGNANNGGDQLSVDSLFLPFLILLPSGFSLVSQLLLSDLLLLHLVDGLDQHRLVLELVTLGSQVEVVIDVLGNFLGLSVLLQKSSEDSLSSHPQNLGWHSSVSGTSSLTKTGMSA